MSVSKSYNRIVFLTTLSVYLGLVLVGGTAPVLAHSALTKHFDVRNEIEFKDDLDNKPDNEEAEISPKEDFSQLFVKLLNEIKESIGSGQISLPLPNNLNLSGELAESILGYGSGTGWESNNKFDWLVGNAIYQGFLPKAIALADYTQGYKNAKVSVAVTDKDFTLKINFSKVEAEQFAEVLNHEFSSSTISVKEKLLKKVYENTKATSENNRVFIVTHLPRAAIDEFLAKTDAQ